MDIEGFDDEDIGDDVNMGPRAKRRKRRRVSQFPRILKRDIRRDISFMFANVMNSGDQSFIASFLNQFCVSSCRSVDYARSSFLPEKVPIKRIEGLPNIVHRVGSELQLIPDFVYRVTESQIEQRLDKPGSKVIMHAHIQGTKLLEPLVHFVDDQNVHRTIPHIFYDALTTAGRVASTNSASTFTLRTAPYDLNVLGVITFSLDNDHRIYRMEFECDVPLPLDF